LGHHTLFTYYLKLETNNQQGHFRTEEMAFL